ncbi:MAG: glycosyltransferase [Syntrophobacteraceae bacterium]
MSDQQETFSGTIAWIAPFYNRSGYGLTARSFVFALHRAGVPVRIFPGCEVEPGLDDFDLSLLKSLESTPLVPPITVIVSHVPDPVWLTFEFPKPNLRILFTTFDSSAEGNAPPPQWIDVCRRMDQVWLTSEKEREVFISAGMAQDKLRAMSVPHLWLENPAIPAPCKETTPPEKRFRFLCIAMFLPRRRWDTLVEAYLEEFREDREVELYLKVNYPSWHPVPGKPRQDLHDLIDSLRQKTGSDAAIILDEDLGTRLGVVRLLDSCNVYVSTDTAHTAPVGEAILRERLTVFPSGVLAFPESCYIPIPNDPAARAPLSPEMLLYQPHHKDALMPRLDLADVRSSLRRAYAMSSEERHEIAADAAGRMYPPSLAVPAALEAIRAGWELKAATEIRTPKAGKRILWEGSHFVSHSLALINRELCLQLIEAGFELSLATGHEVDDIDPASDPRFEKIVRRMRAPLSGEPDVTVRHHWPPNFTPPSGGHWVMIQPWEYGRLPEAWVEPLGSLVDEIWVPSRHVLKTCIASGVPANRVQVVPNGVDPERFHPGATGLSLKFPEKFKFLFVGGGLWRKGVDVLLDAYRRAFTSRDEVVLVIKDLPQQQIYIDQGLTRLIGEIRQAPSAPEILHLQAALKTEELPGLYTTCDCLVHPYRGEGFGLPVLEAMACGVPVIATEGGSTDDFCRPGEVFLIPSERREFAPKDIRLAGGAGWVLEPDANALKNLLREAFEKRTETRQRALGLSVRIRREYDWKNVAALVMERIEKISQRPARRSSRKTAD